MAFGIYVATYAGDWRLAKGCVASLRHQCGDIPICLLVDGSFSTHSVESLPNVTVLRRGQIKNQFLREHSFGGFGYSHLIPFFEGPFNEFFYIDADAVLLGDLVPGNLPPNVDVITPFEFGLVDNDALISANWFLINFMNTMFPAYKAQQKGYFFAGTFFGRQGLFDIQEYQHLLELQRAQPGTSFQCGDQGILNYLIFSGKDSGRLRQVSKDYQLLATDSERLKPAWVEQWRPESSYNIVLHYAHAKPVVNIVRPLAKILGVPIPVGAVCRPMNHYRKIAAQSLNDCRGGVWSTVLAFEDLSFLFRKVQKALVRRLA